MVARRAGGLASAACRPPPEERREALKDVLRQARGCTRCPQLAATRHTVVFGAGHADADLMFVGGGARAANEDEQGLPFVGQAGKLLDQLLGEIGLARERGLHRQRRSSAARPATATRTPPRSSTARSTCCASSSSIEPRVVCTLGNFATKLLRDDPTGITRLHGRDEVRVVGPRAVRLYPLFHPAAALYTPANVEVLRRDFARLPGLLALPEPEQPASPDPAPEPASPEPEPEREPPPEPRADRPSGADPSDVDVPVEQLGLF